MVYLGTSNDGYASILRASAAYHTGFVGSWAFLGTTSSWAFAVDALSDDVRVLGWDGAPTHATTYSSEAPVFPLAFTSLAAFSYAKAGWETYPASDTWSAPSGVYTPPTPPTGGDAAYSVAVAEGPEPLLFGVYVASPTALGVAVLSTRNSTEPASQLGGPLTGASTAVSIAWRSPWLCVAGAGPSSNGGGAAGWEVRVWCVAGNATAPPSGPDAPWVPMGVCASGPGPTPASTSIAVTSGGSVLVAVAPGDESGGSAVVASATAGGSGAAWTRTPLGGVNDTAVRGAATAGGGVGVALCWLLHPPPPL